MPVFVINPHPGLLRRGNIDIAQRAFVRVPAGGGKFASVKTVSWNIPGLLGRPGGAEVLMPTVINRGGKWQIVSEREALARYRSTGQHLGIFDTPRHATAYANRLHLYHAKLGKTIRG